MIGIDGSLYSKISKRYLSPHICSSGYKRASLKRDDGKIIMVRIHRVVADTYINNKSNLPVVNHIDGNKLNNAITNLEWVTYRENNQHAIDTGLSSQRGETNNKAKISEEEAIQIISELGKGTPQKDIADMFKVSKYIVSKIFTNKTWKHLERSF
ncbi:hypothetical protein PSYJYH_000069 [Bacillus phage PSYJ-YH]|nr:hypothetical protein PSYJYH_000069 [Bacillus phage PSYJ-YH]